MRDFVQVLWGPCREKFRTPISFEFVRLRVGRPVGEG